MLVAGDLFDSSSPTPESEEIVYQALLELAHACEWVVVVSGNHDNPRRLSAVEPLMKLTNIRMISTLRRPDDGGVIMLQTETGGARIALFPFCPSGSSSKRMISCATMLSSTSRATRSARTASSTRVLGESAPSNGGRPSRPRDGARRRPRRRGAAGAHDLRVLGAHHRVSGIAALRRTRAPPSRPKASGRVPGLVRRLAVAAGLR